MIFQAMVRIHTNGNVISLSNGCYEGESNSLFCACSFPQLAHRIHLHRHKQNIEK